MNILPKFFIGSSTEGLYIAKKIEVLLDDYADIRIWNDIFQLGDSVMETLIREANLCDYAILVATPDDLKEIRGEQEKTPRDNVIFEAGLFMGRLGKGRTFILCDIKNKTKLPTDLDGVTVATFNTPQDVKQLSKNLEPAVNKISEAINEGGIDTEIDFLRSYLTFIHPDTRVSDFYADILSRRLNSLSSEVKKLEESQNWGKLLEVKSRLREYFEFSGRFEMGIEFGKAFLKALTKLEQPIEAFWCCIKDIGYMYILKSKHELGRDKINKTIIDILDPSIKIEDGEKARLLFYCYRYLAISYQRDKDNDREFKKAKEHLNLAEKQLSFFDSGSKSYKELLARLLRNKGNIEIEKKNYKQSLKLLRQSLELFKELEEKEHTGYSHHAIAKTLVIQKKWKRGEVESHLQEAELIFSLLGIIEAHGRVLEQYARYYYIKSKKTKSMDNLKKYCRDALDAARKSESLFRRMGSERLISRVEELIRHIGSF